MLIVSFFFFNDTATTEIYTLSLHDALPISLGDVLCRLAHRLGRVELLHARVREAPADRGGALLDRVDGRSEEHTSELQSRSDLACRLLLEKKNKNVRADSMSCDHHVPLVPF